MWRAIASNALNFAILGLLIVAGLIHWSKSQWSGRGPLEQAICLQVTGGMSMSKAADALAAQGAVSSRFIFGAGLDYAGRSQDLKAGSFLIEAGSSMSDIADQITGVGVSTCGSELLWRIGVTRISGELRVLDPETGRYSTYEKWDVAAGETASSSVAEYVETSQVKYRIVLAEGVSSWQAREALNGIATLSGEIVDIPAEGALAPGSYEISAGMAAQELLAEMVSNQSDMLASLWADRSAAAVVSTPEEALVLASIIEKETGIQGERGLVASVFTNRLRQGMRLQTDPTVIYGITKGEGVLGRGLRRSELNRATPWNTYQIDGLPPTPIANPGEASIRAALNPEDTEYLFFVADGTGGHSFATTLAEHNRNVARWREIEAQRNGN